jgi:hypothetical protein
MWYGIRLRLAVGLVCLAILLPAGTLAFHYPLQSEEIEQAYYLGQTSDHQKLASFLKQYDREFPYPSDNPIVYVKSVEFQTPYEQIVWKTMLASQYDRFKAADDYRASAGAVFVRVVVAFKIGYAGPIPKAEDFQVNVSQSSPIPPMETASTVPCGPFGFSTGREPCDAYTREFLLHFDHGQFGKGNVTVKVALPEEKPFETAFNLDKLK